MDFSRRTLLRGYVSLKCGAVGCSLNVAVLGILNTEEAYNLWTVKISSDVASRCHISFPIVRVFA